MIGNGSTATLAINGADYNTSGVQTYTANAFTLSGTDPDFNTTNSNVSFVDGATSDIVLSNSANLEINTGSGAGTIDIEPQIKGTGDDANTNVTLNAGTGNIVLDNTGGAVIGTDIGDVSLTGTTITVSHNIVTDGGGIDVNGAFVLNSSGNTITVSSDTTHAGNIDFDTTINATATGGNQENLTIINGSGTVGIGGIIGGTKTLGTLNIAASAATDTGAVTIGQVGADASTAGAGAVTIGHTGNALGSITFTGAEFTTSGAQTFIADGYAVNGADATFTASGQNITFTNAGSGDLVTGDLANLTIDTGSGAAGNIAVGVEIKNTAGDGNDATDVTMTAGSGTISIGAISGDINDVALTSTTSTTLTGDITTATDSDDAMEEHQ